MRQILHIRSGQVFDFGLEERKMHEKSWQSGHGDQMIIGTRPFDLAQDTLSALGNSKKLKLVIAYVLCSMLFALCSSVQAQQAARLYKVGRLSAGSPADPLSKATYEVFREGLRDLGWVDGRNMVIENRWVRDKPESALNRPTL